MTHEIRVGIMLVFTVPSTPTHDKHLEYIIKGLVRENVEQNLPEGMGMKVLVTEVDGQKVEIVYD